MWSIARNHAPPVGRGATNAVVNILKGHLSVRVCDDSKKLGKNKKKSPRIAIYSWSRFADGKRGLIQQAHVISSCVAGPDIVCKTTRISTGKRVCMEAAERGDGPTWMRRHSHTLRRNSFLAWCCYGCARACVCPDCVCLIVFVSTCVRSSGARPGVYILRAVASRCGSMAAGVPASAPVCVRA
jgi:hypothetical protein